MANVVEAISRRRDVRERRAKILVLLLELRCPLGSRPRAPWYVPGAVARLGVEGLRRAWRTRWGVEPPSAHTVRAHLGALEQACLLVRAPGDWLPVRRNPEHPEHRPRYPDTFHLLETDAAATWWAEVGWGLLERSPNARHSPDRWRMLLGDWRKRAAKGAGLFGLDEPAPLPPTRKRTDREAVSAGTLEVAERLEELALEEGRAWELMVGVRDAGVRLTGGFSFQLAGDVPRLRGALAVLVIALRRGDRIRSRPAWLVRAWKTASATERAAALDTLARMRTARRRHGTPRPQQRALPFDD